MIDIESKRFRVKSTGDGFADIRDRDNPYFTHTVRASDLPSANKIALMSERQFDQLVFALIYHGGHQ